MTCELKVAGANVQSLIGGILRIPYFDYIIDDLIQACKLPGRYGLPPLPFKGLLVTAMGLGASGDRASARFTGERRSSSVRRGDLVLS